MTKHVLSFVETLPDLVASVQSYQHQMSNLAALPSPVVEDAIQALARARAWVAVPNGLGGYDVGFAKHCGYKDNTLTHYSTHRKTRDETRLDGTEAERRIKTLGGLSYAVGQSVGLTNASIALRVSHPAVNAVRDFVRSFGKEPCALAEVRVFDLPLVEEGAPEVFAVLLAAINAARLSEDELDDLFERAKAMA